MAFIDDIGKKITQTGQGAVMKTRAFADVARLNGVVAEEEKKINNAYYQIGKMYVGLHPNDYEDDFSALISSVSASEQKIQTLKKQIEEIRGVMRCEKCGAEVEINAGFCSVCGAPMPRVAPGTDTQNMDRCPGCGAYVPKGMRFCTSCGKPMTTPVSAQPQPAAAAPVYAQPQPQSIFAQPPRQPQPAAPQGNFEPNPFKVTIPEESQPAERRCPNCGALMDSDSDFCTECGTRL